MAILDEGHSEAASEAAFTIMAARLHALRPKLRTVVVAPYLDHPAYAEGNFPIWWQGQNNDQFITQAKPAYFVRFSHHPINTFRGIFQGHASIQCYAQTEPWIETLRDLVMGAYPVGEVTSENGFDVAIKSVDAKSAWPVNGVDRNNPWPVRANFMIPVSVLWNIDLNPGPSGSTI